MQPLINSAANAGNVIFVGKCKQCGKRNQLPYRGSVCGCCSSTLDAEWGKSDATDWVLITTSLAEDQRSVIAILCELKATIAKMKGQPEPAIPANSRTVTVHVFRNTNYAEMKVFWAAGEPSDGLGLGHASAVDQTKIRSLLASHPDSEDAAFIRPASAAELAQDDQKRREDARDKIIAETLEKWGFDDEWNPLENHGGEQEDIQRRKSSANEEINRIFQDRGLS